MQTTVPVRNALDMVLEKDVTRIVFCKSKGRISEKTKGGMTFTITDLKLSAEYIFQISAGI